MGKRILSFVLAVMIVVAMCPVLNVNAADSLNAGEYVYLGRFEQDNDLNDGKEMLLWRVLSVEGDKALVLSNKIIDTVTVYQNENYSWDGSGLQKWCRDFLSEITNFSDSERAIILDTVLPDTGTTDKMFFLSSDEASSYLPKDQDRLAEVTPYTPPDISTGKQLSDYWLRSALTPYWIELINGDEGWFGTCQNLSMGNYTFGARPACYINLSDLVISDGNGTKENPFVTTASNYSTDNAIKTVEDIALPIEKLDTISNQDTAVSVIASAAEMMTAEQKNSPTSLDLITLFAEEATAQAACKIVASSDILINQANIQELQSVAVSTRTAAEGALYSAEVITAREMSAGVKFKTVETNNVNITVDPSAVGTIADNVRVETPNYVIAFSTEAIKTNAGDTPLIVTITEITSTVAGISCPIVTASTSNHIFYDLGSDLTAMTANGGTTYKITFNKPVTENIKVSLPPASGDNTYQAVTRSDGTAVGGKYNPVTGMLDVKIKNSDTYTVKDNKKDFSDIQSKSKEMQAAIRVMASKGIINGISATTFGPEGTITRAEIAALIVRTLSELEPNANGGFTDVKSNDWYCGAVGSAKKFRIINGTSATTFAPKANIQKDQIVAVSARTLRAEMRYKNPGDVEKWLGVYTDRSTIPSWGNTDIALATRENLVVRRTDGKFLPAGTMTRGDAAIILYRMFMKIW